MNFKFGLTIIIFESEGFLSHGVLLYYLQAKTSLPHNQGLE